MSTKITKKTQPKAHIPEAVSCFIKKTYEFLEEKKFPDIIDWNSEGTAIVIKKPTEFSQKVLPIYFKHNNLTSFVRQLNMYGFHKRRTEEYDHVYYHELFQRSMKHSLHDIKRRTHDNHSTVGKRTIENSEVTTEDEDQGNVEKADKATSKKILSQIADLEEKVKQLSTRNQALSKEITTKNKNENMLVSFLAIIMKNKNISLNDLPKKLVEQLPLISQAAENSFTMKREEKTQLENYQEENVENDASLNFEYFSNQDTYSVYSSELSHPGNEKDNHNDVLSTAPETLNELTFLPQIDDSCFFEEDNNVRPELTEEQNINGKRSFAIGEDDFWCIQKRNKCYSSQQVCDADFFTPHKNLAQEIFNQETYSLDNFADLI